MFSRKENIDWDQRKMTTFHEAQHGGNVLPEERH